MPPPVPESPSLRQTSSSGTPRVGMHLYENEEDDVSVLTFNTINSKSSNSSFVKSARENLERMILESNMDAAAAGVGVDGECDKSLARISEETLNSSTCTRSTRKSARSNSTRKTDDDSNDDDDTISLAESILDSANKILSSIGSSPYYQAGRKENEDSTTPALPYDELTTTSKIERLPSKAEGATDSLLTKSPTGSVRSTKEDTHRDDFHEEECFADENVKPSTNFNRNNHSIYKKGSSKFITTSSGDENLQKLESETRHLQMLLEKRQIETKKASQNLGSSIQKANALLERLSANRIA